MSTVSQWLNFSSLHPSILKTLQIKLHKKKPFPHLIIPHFLPEEKALSLLQALTQEHFELKESDLFTLYQTKDFISSKNKILRQFRSMLCSTEFLSPLEAITNLKLKIHTLDIAGTIYTDTNYLLPHDDQLDNRKIAFIYYLSTLKKSDGGALAFYQSKNHEPTTIVKRTQPTFNTFLLFPVTSTSFHQVEEVLTNTQRIAISGWFHGN